MSADPYVYPGSDVLINKENLRNYRQLERFERLVTVQRLSEDLPNVPLSADGYRALHRHLFQDVYDWAGKDRTVDMRKNGPPFCRCKFVEIELIQRFKHIQADNYLRGTDRNTFAARAADHFVELNAIHPFREGNGRTLQAFLRVLGQQAGYDIVLSRIDPAAWNTARQEGFLSGDSRLLAEVIRSTMAGYSPEQSVGEAAAAIDADETDWLTTLQATERNPSDTDELDLAPRPKR